MIIGSELGNKMQSMVWHSDTAYFHQRLLPAIINFLSLNNKDSYDHLHQKNLDVSSHQTVFSHSILQYHKCCAALYCIITVFYCNICCKDEKKKKTILQQNTINFRSNFVNFLYKTVTTIYIINVLSENRLRPELKLTK